MDVSVLLNFSSRISFEKTDPLMSLVAARAPLLFYDRLTVGEFCTDEIERIPQALREIRALRNLLEARAISTEGNDDGEIRLLFLLDLPGTETVGGVTKRIYPSQKVGMVQRLVQGTFGPDNPLLKKVQYAFIFLFGDNDGNWPFLRCGDILGNALNLNRVRDGLFGPNGLNGIDEDSLIDISAVYAHYQRLLDRIAWIKSKVADVLDNGDIREAFERSLEAKLNSVETVGDLERYDFDEAVRCSLNDAIGLSSGRLGDRSVFFLLHFDEKEDDKVFAKSLIQLLSTIGPEQYRAHFKSQPPVSIPRTFILGEPNVMDINKQAMYSLQACVSGCIKDLQEQIWKENEEVEGLKQYVENTQSLGEVDTHKELNEMLNDRRRALYDEFVDKRRVPFFFGKRIDDWGWYAQVVEKVMALYDFEDENDRPLYDMPRRITNDEMSEDPQATMTYRQLAVRKSKLEKEVKEIGEARSLSEYMSERRSNMARFASKISELEEEMPKLGYLACLFWIGFLSIVAFALCFAYHFFWFDNADPLYLIAIAAGAAGLLFTLASLIGQRSVKKRIRGIYRDIDDIWDQMQKNLEQFILSVRTRAERQRRADINRRNLDAIEEKLDLFERHNLQISLWTEHFSSMKSALDFMLERLSGQGHRTNVTAMKKLTEDHFLLDSSPALPYVVRRQFEEMSVTLQNEAVIQPVTSFVKHFRFVESD